MGDIIVYMLQTGSKLAGLTALQPGVKFYNKTGSTGTSFVQVPSSNNLTSGHCLAHE